MPMKPNGTISVNMNCAECILDPKTCDEETGTQPCKTMRDNVDYVDVKGNPEYVRPVFYRNPD